MMTRQHERTSARKSAAQVLYSGAIRDVAPSELVKSASLDCLDEPLSDYALRLIEGVEANRAQIDDMLSSISENWTIERMPVMDLAILRLALFEMLHVDEVPISVSINEAVELAKSFGGEDDSPRFVNGMLGNVARQLEQADGVQDPAEGDRADGATDADKAGSKEAVDE